MFEKFKDILVVFKDLFVNPEQTIKISDKKYIVTFLKANSINCNNRLYSRKILENIEKQFEEYSKKKKDFYGKLGISYKEDSCYDAQFIIKNIFLEGDYLKAEIEIDSIFDDKVLENALENNLNSVYFRAGGEGDLNTDKNGIGVIDENYKLYTICAYITEKNPNL